MVMMKNENDIATKWSMGRVVEKFPGNDGLTRVVKLKTANGERTRAITKVAPLPITDKNDIMTTTSQIARITHRQKRRETGKLWSPAMVPVVALLLTAFLQPVSGETSAYDLVKEAIKGAVTVFTSDTARVIASNWKNITPVQQRNVVNELMNDGLRQTQVNDFIEQSMSAQESKSESAWRAWIFIAMVLGVTAIAWLGYAARVLCIGMKEATRNDEELQEVELAPVPKPRNAITFPARENVTIVTI